MWTVAHEGEITCAESQLSTQWRCGNGLVDIGFASNKACRKRRDALEKHDNLRVEDKRRIRFCTYKTVVGLLTCAPHLGHNLIRDDHRYSEGFGEVPGEMERESSVDDHRYPEGLGKVPRKMERESSVDSVTNQCREA
jgi:hypothetical protein